jgi:hypothetical protein
MREQLGWRLRKAQTGFGDEARVQKQGRRNQTKCLQN